MSTWHDVWAETKKGAKRGAHEALVGFFGPLQPRFWRYVAGEARKGPLAAFLGFWKAYDLISQGRLDSDGRECTAAPRRGLIS